MGLVVFLAILLPGAVLGFAAARREGASAGWLLPLALVGYVVGAKAAAFVEAWDPRAMPVMDELLAPWRQPWELLPAAAGATIAVAVGVILLRRKSHA